MVKKRIQYIDLAKAVAIMLMVVGHYIQIFYEKSCNSNAIFISIYSFHMPLFFVLSGMVFRKPRDGEGFIKWGFKKFKQLIIPSYIFILLTIFFMWLFSLLNVTLMPFNNEVSIKSIIRTILQFRCDALVTALWFLPTLFCTEIIIGLLHMVIKKDIWRLVIVALLFVIGAAYILIIKKPLPFSIDNSILLCVFFEAGYLLKKNINKLTVKRSIVIIVASFIIWGVSAFSNYWWFGKKPVALSYIDLGNPILFFLAAFAGSLLVILICYMVKPLKESNRLLRYGQNTLYIYGLNQIIISIIYCGIYQFIENNIWLNILCCMIVTIIVLESSSYISIFMKKKVKKHE